MGVGRPTSSTTLRGGTASTLKELTVPWEMQINCVRQLDVQEAVEREAEKPLMQTPFLGIEKWLNIQEGFLEGVPELSFG